MDKKYRLTVIGAGDRGTCYMEMLRKYFDGRILWDTVCDIQPNRLEKAYEAYGFNRKTDQWERAIAEDPADIVLIATPAYYHCDIAMFAMRHGCHVLTEKPLDLSLAKCFALEECCRETGKVLGVGMQYRNTLSHRAVKNAIDRGLLGGNRMIQYTDMRETRPKTAMHDARFGNGGPMVDMSCHFIDLMRWYFGCDPVRVTAQWRTNAADRPSLAGVETKAPDACCMTVEYADGSLGNILLNWGLPAKVNGKLSRLVTGSEGLIDTSCISDGDKAADVLVEGGIVVPVGGEPGDEDDLIHPERAVFQHFLAEIEGAGHVQTSIREGILCLAASMAAIRSSVLGRPVTLEEIFRLQPTVYQCMTAQQS